MVKMTYTRRHLGKIVLAALPGGKLLAKPNSRYGGVQIGIILSPTALRDIPISADEVLKNLVELGIGGIEMQDVRVEKYAGAPPALQGAGRTPLTAEQQEARHKADAEIKTWRLSASMDRYKALRRKYADSYSQFLPDHCPAMLTWELQLPRNPIEDLPPPQLACQFNSTISGRVVDALFTHLGNDRAATEFIHSANQSANSA